MDFSRINTQKIRARLRNKKHQPVNWLALRVKTTMTTLNQND